MRGRTLDMESTSTILGRSGVGRSGVVCRLTFFSPVRPWSGAAPEPGLTTPAHETPLELALIIARHPELHSRTNVRRLVSIPGVDQPAPSLEILNDAQLEELRLGAQVLSHRAGSERNPPVARYFAALEDALKAEIARRAAVSGSDAPVGVDLPRPPDAEDRRLVAEYLGLLIGNERLSVEVRTLSRALRARDSR